MISDRMVLLAPKRRKNHATKNVQFVIGEGASEKVYFDDAGRLFTNVSMNTVDAKGKSIEYIKDECMKVFKKAKPGDNIAVTIDVDQRSYGELQQFQQWCRKHSIDLYISNPSMEVWLLMHYKPVPARLEQKELEEDLSIQLGHKYEKSEGIPISREKIDKAMERARAVLPHDPDPVKDVFERRGTTSLHLLVDKIKNWKSNDSE